MIRHATVTAALLFWTWTPTAFPQTSFTNSGAITVPAGGSGSATTYPSTLNVTGLSGTISKVTIRLNNFSGPADELDALLVAPTGQALVFASDVAPNLFPTLPSNISPTFDDDAAGTVPDGSFTTATYRPTANGSNLSEFPGGPASYSEAAPAGTGTLANTFNGLNPNGNWLLYVRDDTGGNGVSISGGWTLTITVQVAQQPTSTTIISNLNPSFTSAPNASVLFTATVTSGGNPVTAGSVTFSAAGVPFASNIALNGSGQAVATTSFATEGVRAIVATYNGTPSFGTSIGSVSQEVNNHTTGTSPTFCNVGPITQPATGTPPIVSTPYPQKTFVTGLSGTVSFVTLTLTGISHAGPEDLDVLLVSPTGQRFVALSDVGGSFSTTGAPVTLTLTDSAGSLLPSTALSSGSFRPTDRTGTGDTFPAPAPAGPYSEPATEGSATFVSTFGGINPNGTWSLYVADDISGAGGSINGGHCLTFTTTGDTPTTTTIISSQNPSLTGNNVTFTATVTQTTGGAAVTSGTVTFLEGATVLAGPLALNGSGQASFSSTTLAEGTHVITASYSGVPGAFNLSNGNVTQTVDDPTVVTGNQFCNPGPVTVPSNGTASPYPARIFVSGLGGPISKVTATLNGVTHQGINDLDVLLVGPGGQNIVIWSDIGGNNPVTNQNFILDDTAANSLPTATAPVSGTYRPTAVNTSGATSFPSPAVGPFNFAAPFGSTTFGSTFNNASANGTWSFFIFDDTGSATGTLGDVCVTITTTPPDLSITKTHSGNFTQGQIGASYTVTVTNNGPGSTAGTVTVTEAPPAGLSVTSMSGSGWTCPPGLSCTRSDALASGSSYPAITVVVDVANNAGSPLVNQASVSGSGDNTSGNNTASDSTIIDAGSVDVSVGTNPAGLSYSVDGSPFTATQVFSWQIGSPHTIATTSPQGTGGTRYVFDNWSDAGAISHSVNGPATPTTYTANFNTQYELTTSVAPTGGGTVSPSGGFFDPGPLQLTATPNACFTFDSWSANAPGGLVQMNAPQSVTANFVGAAATNVTAQLQVTASGYVLNRATGRYRQTLTLTNTGAALTNLAIALDNLTSGVSLFGSGGLTNCAAPANSPFRVVGPLGAGASTSLLLEFVNPSALPITYTRRMLAGSDQR